MWIYWSIYVWPAVLALSRRGLRSTALSSALMWIFGVTLTVIIGLRYQIGVDWPNYLSHLDIIATQSLPATIREFDPLYGLAGWLAVQTGLGIWLVNLTCATAFVTGFVLFARETPNPWLAIAVGIPYLAIIVGMNYTRQAAALGFVFLALISIERGKLWGFVAFIILAAGFHRSAAALMPLALAIRRPSPWIMFIVIIGTSVGAYLLFLSTIQDFLVYNYFGLQQTSEGAGVRIAMDACAGSVYLLLRRRFDLDTQRRRLWDWCAVASLLFIPALILSPSSTAVDRVAIYFMPVQSAVFARLPSAVRFLRLGALPIVIVLLGYAAVEYVWFSVTTYRSWWVPYHLYPFGS